MSWIQQLAIGAAVVLAVVLSLIWLAKKGTFEPESNEDSPQEREDLEESVGSQDFRIPMRRRVSSWSLPYKIFVGSIALLFISIAVASYQMMKTGSPAQQYLTAEVRYGLVAVMGIAGGVRLKSWFDQQIGELIIRYERSGQENIVEKVPFARDRVSRRNGNQTIQEIATSRMAGLFWRYRQVGEDRRLRGEDKPLGDIIQHQIPDHADELPDGDGFVVSTREGGDQILSGATSRADITYGSPNSLSDERATQLREQKRRKEAELSAVQATNAELNRQIRKMRKKIKNEEYEDREGLMEDFGDFSDMLSTLRVEISDEKQNGSTSAVDSDDKEASA